MAVPLRLQAVRCSPGDLLPVPARIAPFRDPIHGYRCVGTFAGDRRVRGPAHHQMRQRVERPSVPVALVPLPSQVPVDMHANVEALAMVPSYSHQHGRPLLCRVRLPRRSPTSTLLCRPFDSLPPSATAPFLANGLPIMRALCSMPQGANDTCARNRCRGVGTGHRLSAQPGWWSRRGEGLPGYGTVLFVRAMVEHPAGDTSLLAQKIRMQGVLWPSGKKQDPRPPGKTIGFGAACPMATRSHAYASPTTFLGSRKACYRLTAGSPLGRAGFAPAGRYTKFHEVISHLHSPSTGIAWSTNFFLLRPPWSNGGWQEKKVTSDSQNVYCAGCQTTISLGGADRSLETTGDVMTLPRTHAAVNCV